MQAVFQVAGTGVSPFNTTKQAVLLIAVASVMTTITQDQIGIILVEDATSLARRKLLQIDEEEVRSTLCPSLMGSPGRVLRMFWRAGNGWIVPGRAHASQKAGP